MIKILPFQIIIDTARIMLFFCFGCFVSSDIYRWELAEPCRFPKEILPQRNNKGYKDFTTG